MRIRQARSTSKAYFHNNCSTLQAVRTTTDNGSSSPGPVWRAEPVGCVPERLHFFSWEEGCRGRHGEAAIVWWVLLVQGLYGHTSLLKAYANLLDPSADPLCPLCKEEPQAIEHWLWRCPRLDATRQNIFGSDSLPFEVLNTDPKRVLVLARITLG